MEKGIIIGKMIELLKNDKYEMSEAKACEIVGIHRETWMAWKKQHDSIPTEVKKSRNENMDKAYQSLAQALDNEVKQSAAGKNTSIPISRWYMERRDPKFKEKQQVDIDAVTTFTDFVQLASGNNKGDDNTKDNAGDSAGNN